MTAARAIFVCFRCEHRTAEHFEQCPTCGLWQSAVPEDQRDEAIEPIRIGDVPATTLPRIPTGLDDWDKATGGGFVPGFSYLVYGPPGTRKTRDLLRVAARAHSGSYVSTEMGWELLIRSAIAVGAEDARAVCVEPATDVPAWPTIRQLCKTRDLVIVDSLSRIADRDTPAQLHRLSRETGHTVKIFVVQMDKEHKLFAGPADLAHNCDCVIVARKQTLVTTKNRAGEAPLHTTRTTPATS